MDALTPDLELRLRTELAERRIAELTAALENMKVEMDRWRTIAESDCPGRRTESALTRSEAREWWWRLTA